MAKWSKIIWISIVIVVLSMGVNVLYASEVEGFPRSVQSYDDDDSTLFEKLQIRIEAEPFNLIATLIFLFAIVHTMLTSFFHSKAHDIEVAYEQLIKEGKKDKHSHSLLAGVFHLIGEVEVVFGIWAIALAIAITGFYGWDTFVGYINGLHYTEPLFVIVVMTIASSRPIIKITELLMWRLVSALGASLEAWWLCILILTPLLGSIITEPAAMTIGAFLLSDKFYSLNPSKKVMYGTLALLFVNVSIGGALTNFAAPPILMVAGPWAWSTPYMFVTFGIKSMASILLATGVYYALFKKDLSDLKLAYEHHQYKRYIQHRFISQKELEANFESLEQVIDKRVSFFSELNAYSFILKENIKAMALEKLTPEEIIKYDINKAIDEKFEGIKQEEWRRTLPGLLPETERPKYIDPNWDKRENKVPLWIMMVHLLFLLWTVFNAHQPVLFITGFLFFLGFYQVTAFYQNRLDLKPALLVAFFLAGLMVHGTLQGWWIAPLLGSLPPLGLNLTAIVLTAFNDNASITYLSTLVTDLNDAFKYAIVSGAITGGGLTLIANAPNPVGQSILKKHFDTGISSLMLLKYALLPTGLTAIVFFVFK